MYQEKQKLSTHWLRYVPVIIALFILLDVVLADLFLLKQPKLLYTKLAWFELIAVVLLLRIWPWPLILSFFAALATWAVTLDFQIFFSSFPVVILFFFWLFSSTYASWRTSRRVKTRETEGDLP